MRGMNKIIFYIFNSDPSQAAEKCLPRHVSREQPRAGGVKGLQNCGRSCEDPIVPDKKCSSGARSQHTADLLLMLRD